MGHDWHQDPCAVLQLMGRQFVNSGQQASPTEAPQVRALTKINTGNPQTKRNYAVHDGTIARMRLQAS
jgi:hypothetical protein